MNSDHIPFRQCTLTKVLRDSFIGEKSRTCMVRSEPPTCIVVLFPLLWTLQMHIKHTWLKLICVSKVQNVFTCFPCCDSIDCNGVSRHGFMWIHDEHATLCGQVIICLVQLAAIPSTPPLCFSGHANLCRYILSEQRSWRPVAKLMKQLRHKSLSIAPQRRSAGKTSVQNLSERW